MTLYELTCRGSWQEIPTVHILGMHAIVFLSTEEVIIRTFVRECLETYAVVKHVAEGLVRVETFGCWTLETTPPRRG